ncbi:MAG: ROK family protein [Anaerolineales bacterium]|jgi:fructokinase|uniref:ROK family protein n=1 Tax=Candidatus Villigracilis affinis TaxID=3140682 RepID=UPI001D8CF3EC|nr:ROK family protein [Anaerolineales bacterium]MBK9603030.1 ROK family protein [Anaerolineales bacterium]
MEKLFGGIEGGGTKFNCAVGNGPENIIAEARFATTTPAETIGQVCDFFAPYVNQLQGIGLGSFGPFDVDPASPTYGYITTTPKPNWANANILGMLREKINLPFAVDMDVVVAGLGEAKWGASKNDSHSLYLTIGTGIGGGHIVDGKPLRGLTSLEMGHIRIPHNFELDPFQGACPYHGDCFEGLAAGPAVLARFGQRGETLPDDHPYWNMEAGYIAHALVNFILSLAPQRIIIGGGVMQKDFMFPAVRRKTQELLNGYISHDMILNHIDEYIVPPALGGRAGELGCIALAMQMDS